MKKLSDREIFQQLCYNETTEVSKSLSSKISNLTNICRHCKTPVLKEDFAVHVGYWTPLWYCVHKQCLQEHKAEEAYLCQCIDMGCNDCKFFQRNQNNEKLMNTTLNCLFPKINSHIGTCTKHNCQVEALPNSYQGMPCFKHRKDDN